VQGEVKVKDLMKELPQWRQAQLRQERREAAKAAMAFARICREGDAANLYNAHLLLNECSLDAWRLAMIKVARLPRVTPEIQAAFLGIWIESKMLPLRVGNRRVLANALSPPASCSISSSCGYCGD
jgi:hypothetical protein